MSRHLKVQVNVYKKIYGPELIIYKIIYRINYIQNLWSRIKMSRHLKVQVNVYKKIYGPELIIYKIIYRINYIQNLWSRIKMSRHLKVQVNVYKKIYGPKLIYQVYSVGLLLIYIYICAFLKKKTGLFYS